MPKPKKERPAKLHFRAVCTVPGCGWKGEPGRNEQRAKKPGAKHSLEKHIDVQTVMVRRVVTTEVVES